MKRKNILLIMAFLFLSSLIFSSLNDFKQAEREEIFKLFEDEKVAEKFLIDINKPRIVEKAKKIPLPSPKDDRTINYDMVIVTNNSFFNYFENYAEIKNEEGIKTYVVSTATIGSTPSAIRSWLTSQKQNNPSLKYLLLGGDASIIPTGKFMSIVSGETGYFPTDLYYSNVLSTWNDDLSLMDPEDFEPDLYVGRIPANEVIDVFRYITKYNDYRHNISSSFSKTWHLLANNIQRIPGNTAGNYLINSILEHVDESITADVTYEEDILNLWHENLGYDWPVDQLPDPIPDSLLAGVDEYDRPLGVGQFVGDLLDEGSYNFIFTATHGNMHTFCTYNIDAERYEPDGNSMHCRSDYNWYEDDYKNCYLPYEIKTYNNPYVFWLSSCSPSRIYLYQYDANIPDAITPCPYECISQQMFSNFSGPVSIYSPTYSEYPFITNHAVGYFMDLQFLGDEHKLGYITRHSWDYFSQIMMYTGIKKMVAHYMLFGDPSMDVWSAESEKLVTYIEREIISTGTKFKSVNSSGQPVDAMICVINSSNELVGRGTSPYTYEGRIQDDWIITSNKANYIQARNTFGEINNYSKLPYTMSFENGIDYNWEMHSTSNGRIKVTENFSPHSGQKHLTMDSDESGFAQNEAWLHLDLSGENRVMLDFWWKEFNDETHTGDGVYFSDDGGDSFTKVYSFDGDNTTDNTWEKIELDMDELIITYELEYTSNFVIKFQQYDDNPISVDGFAFDDIFVFSNYAYIPYSTGFESGFDKYWETVSSNEYGRILITGANSPHTGRRHLTMDVNTNNHYSTNEAKLHLNFTSINQAELTFWWKEFNDETHSNDGVYFSDDGGTNFTKVHSLSGGSTTWQEIELDIDQLAGNYNLDLTSHFVIKFQQYDNYSISSDGFAFDDISINETGGGTRDGIDDNEIVSTEFLLSNSPNPFNPSTTISFSIPEESEIELIIYNIKGQKVKTLANSKFNKGNHSIIWSGKDENDKTVSSGLYFVRLKTLSSNNFKKIMLIK
jgi:hypothetical protein